MQDSQLDCFLALVELITTHSSGNCSGLVETTHVYAVFNMCACWVHTRAYRDKPEARDLM